MKDKYLSIAVSKKYKMNKNIASFIFMVTAILLYDLLFDLTWLFPHECYYTFYVVGAVLCFHVVIAAICQANCRNLHCMQRLLLRVLLHVHSDMKL